MATQAGYSAAKSSGRDGRTSGSGSTSGGSRRPGAAGCHRVSRGGPHACSRSSQSARTAGSRPTIVDTVRPRRSSRSANAAASSAPASTGTRFAPTWQAATRSPSTYRPHTSPPSSRGSSRVERARCAANTLTVGWRSVSARNSATSGHPAGAPRTASSSARREPTRDDGLPRLTRVKPCDVARAAAGGRRPPRRRAGRPRSGPRWSSGCRRPCRTPPRARSTSDDGMDVVHLGLTAGRPWDLVLDVAGGKGAARRWPVLLHHVRRGGRVAVRLPGRARGPSQRTVRRGPGRPGSGLEAPTPGRDPRDNPERDLAALAASAADLAIEDGWLRRNQRRGHPGQGPRGRRRRLPRGPTGAGRVLTTILPGCASPRVPSPGQR